MHLIKPANSFEAENFVQDELGFSSKELSVFPKFFLLETINTCNARCIMCAIDFSKPLALMPERLFDKILDELSDHKSHIEKVMPYLDGEPLMDKGLADKIRRLKAAGIKTVNIATNASMLTKKKGMELLDAGLDQIYITIESLNKDVFEGIRIGLKFEQVYRNTIDFIKLRNRENSNCLIRLQTIIQEKNHTEIPDWIAHWKGVLSENDQVVAVKAHNWGAQTKVMEFGDEKDINDIPCIALWGTFVVHQNGIVPLCCMDTNTTVPIGDLNKQSISEIWKSAQLNRIRQSHLTGKRAETKICDGCTLWRPTKKHSNFLVGAD